MKRIIATIIAAAMLMCCFSLPCVAADVSSGIHLVVEYDIDTGVLKLSGTMAVSMGRDWATFYMLYPGKTRADIPAHTKDNPVFSNYAEIAADSDGTFEYEFVHSGDPGVYTLYFTTGYAQITREIDTTTSVKSESNRLEALKALPTSYEAPKGTTVKTLFKEKVGELPSEMPVIRAADIAGLSEVFVDVKNGDDATADGTIDKPYKTVTAALAARPPETGRVLYLREGTYPMSDGLSIKKVEATEELPFIVSNYNDEKVTITGGTNIKSSDFEKVTDSGIIQRLAPEVVDDILVVDLKEKYGMTDYGDITTDSSPVLFVGESKYQIARWPNSETTVMRKYEGEDGENGVIDSGYINTAVGSNCGDNRSYSKRATEKNAEAGSVVDTDQGIQFCIEDIRPFSWVDTGDIWVYGKFYDDWTLNHLNITEFHPENRSIRTATGLSWGCQYVSRTGYTNSFYYYNILEELDTPGEWFVDKETGKLYIYPTGDIENSEIVYAATDASQMWYIGNCKNVVVNGINFEKARGRALNIAGPNTEGVVVQNCSFENVGNGIYVEGKYSGVINSSFKDMEGKGVYIAGNSTAEKKALTPDRQFVQNCVFYNTKGINSSGVGQIISHNFISNNIGTCISVTGNEIVVEYNEIVAGPRAVDDAGCIYVNGNNMFNRGNHVRYNYIHDAAARAIYFDDMLSECYGYGNIIDGSWFQLHNTSEITVYNNIILNYTSSSGEGPIRNQPNYWRSANTAGTRWVTGTLNYGSFTKKLKASEGYGGDEENNTLTGAYADRYPLLKTWAERMYQRIDEYESNGKTSAAAKTSSINSPYTHTWEKPKTFLGYTYGYETVTEQVNLNDYLSAARDNYYANNVMINCAENVIDMPKNENGKYTLPFAYTTSGDYANTNKSGYIGTIDENNYYLTSDENPFDGTTFADTSAYEKIREYVSTFETIPFDKIGLRSEDDYTVNTKTHSISPVDTTEISISAKDLSLQWASVTGAQEYTVEIASDAEFTDIIESATTYDLSYKVETSLESDKTYYWRVSTEATAKCSTGSVAISDTFKFKTMVESQSAERNQVGVTVYSVDDMTQESFKVTTYAYNTTDTEKEAKIHIACYSEDGRLVSTKNEKVTIAADSLTSEYVFEFTAPNTKKIKLFVWSADDNMIPYTFVKTIK